LRPVDPSARPRFSLTKQRPSLSSSPPGNTFNLVANQNGNSSVNHTTSDSNVSHNVISRFALGPDHQDSKGFVTGWRVNRHQKENGTNELIPSLVLT